MSEKVTLRLAEDSELGAKGEVVTLALSPSDVHQAEEMPSYLAGYRNATYRAAEASPVILVDKDTDYFRSFSSDNAFRKVKVKGSPEDNVPEVNPSSSLSSYKVQDRFVGSFVSDVTEQNAGANYKPKMRAMKKCANAIELDIEVDFWSMIQATAAWATGYHATLAAGAKWNGGASADPIADLQARMEASAQPVTGIWFNEKVKNSFLRHALVRDYMKQMIGDNPASISDDAEDFKIPGFPPFHVVKAKVKNETNSALDYILGNHCVLTCSPAGVPTDGEDIATSYTFRRRGSAGVGFGVREFRVEQRGGKGGSMVVVEEASVSQMTGNNCGGLIVNCWA